ncbi:hypothetical protein [Pseudoduganella buxea]|uniref:Uncharacterized protein n=1 Tax=Pseudoduganella buxea TaxID=1949069 RepID=A0A6I3SSU6_9BURK|nr:hypothetical protein [Pseudoduganella buxea]MTV52059.1 hypothetical protein [Pseudoduganella buxea]
MTMFFMAAIVPVAAEQTKNSDPSRQEYAALQQACAGAGGEEKSAYSKE